MNTAAVICEYNPMHGGHRAMLGAIRGAEGEDCVILCVMSGDFVQRGEPAVYDKYARAAAAIDGGADVVLELPYPWSSSVAEHFASGALSIIRKAGGASSLWFGSEGKNEEELSAIAADLTSAEFAEKAAEVRRRDRTLSYPRLIAVSYAEAFSRELSLQPNETLALEYLKILQKEGSGTVAHALPLVGGYSAGTERARIRAEGGRGAAFLENGGKAILAHLILSGGKDRFSRGARGVTTVGALMEKVRTPSDTDARLKRELLSVLLCANGAEREEPRFTVLLGANARGRRWLKETKKTRAIPVIVKQARAALDARAREQYALYRRAQDFYGCFTDGMRSAEDAMRRAPYLPD
ncbi:MAG: nucleotidyltransferase family protein [Clostridia bacterium]|nr:nucleotidyltransferase family protein [Clostridia bacterium]